jgi:hypothetical protein
MDAWHEFTMEEARRRNVMARTLQRLQKRTAVLALEFWQSNIQELRWHQRVLEKVTRRMKNSAAFKTFATWEDKTKKIRRQRAVVLKVGLRIKNSCISAAFGRWMDIGTETKSIIAKSNYIVLRWKQQAVVQCLFAWRELAVEEQHKREMCRKLILRMQHETLSYAFDGFCERVEESKEMKRKVARVVSRWQRPALQFCWDLWMSYLCAEADARDKQANDGIAAEALEMAKRAEAERQRMEAELRQKLMTRIVQRMLSRTLALTFERWHSNVVEKQMMVAKARKVLGRWANRCLARTMDAWHEFTMEEARRRNVMARTLQRLQKRTAVLALELWYSNTVAAKAGDAEKENYCRLYEEEMLGLKQSADRALGLLRAEFERERQEEEWQREKREADVRSQLEALEADLAREVQKAERKKKDLEQNGSGFRTPRDVHFTNSSKPHVPELNFETIPMVRCFDDVPQSVSSAWPGRHGQAEPHACGRVAQSACNRDKQPWAVGGGVDAVLSARTPRGDGRLSPAGGDQLLYLQTRIAELRAERSGLGAKIHLQLAEVNLNLEEYKLDLKSSMDLSSKALIRDSLESTAHKLKQLEKELKRAEHPRKSRPSEDHPSLKDLKAVRTQQGPHSHFDGAPLLSSQLPKGYSVASNPSDSSTSRIFSRTQEIQQLIDDLKRPRQTDNQPAGQCTDEQSGVCGRPGWFNS